MADEALIGSSLHKGIHTQVCENELMNQRSRGTLTQRVLCVISPLAA